MNTNIRFHFVAAVMASLILLSCASTQLSHTWRDASYTAGPLKKILVVAVRKDQARRRVWEDGFAAALCESDMNAIPSYRRIAEMLPDTGLINTIAREGSYDGIMLVGRGSPRTTEGVLVNSITTTDTPYQPW